MKTRRSEAGAQAEADLKFWGYSVGKQYAADGFSAENTLANLLSGRSDLNPFGDGFGVNVRDMPADAWRINARVMRLRSELRCVLVARFCAPMHYETGQPFTREELATALGMTPWVYDRRLREAREKFARLLLEEINTKHAKTGLTPVAA